MVEVALELVEAALAILADLWMKKLTVGVGAVGKVHADRRDWRD